MKSTFKLEPVVIKSNDATAEIKGVTCTVEYTPAEFVELVKSDKAVTMALIQFAKNDLAKVISDVIAAVKKAGI